MIDPDLHPTTLWRVQWIGRPDIGAPEQLQGYRDFATEAEARTWLTSPEVQSLIGAYWRVELRRREPWQTVEAGAYVEEAA